MRPSASAWIFLLAASVPAERSRADPTDPDVDAWRSLPAVASVQPRVPAVLTMSYGGGAGALGRAPHGFFAAGDGGAAVFLPEKDFATRVAAAFGVRAGYHWRNGLALTLCFDDLGVEPSKGGGALLIPSVSVRYSLPFVVEPFAEAMAGGVFDQAMAAPTAGL